MTKKTRFPKILVLVLIAAAIAGMWLVKNRKRTPENLELVQTATAPSGNLADADFSLRETDAIDFKKMAAYGIPLIVDYGADTCIPC